MKNINEYDKRQLILMQECLDSFEMKKVDLNSLVSSLEFLLNALETVDEKWEAEFVKEITTLETINALTIIKESGEDISEIRNDKKEFLVNKSVEALKRMVFSKLTG